MKSQPLPIRPSTKTDRSSHIQKVMENKRQKSSSPIKMELPKIVMLTTFPPRECGIATYSQDLIGNLVKIYGDSFDLKVCPLYDNNQTFNEQTEFSLNTDSKESYQKLSHQINDDPTIKMVMIQHEFGLFNGCDPMFIDFLKSVKKPVIIGFHTVIPSPNQQFLDHVKAIGDHVAQITVMTQSSKNILVNDYGISADTIEVITHGTHLIKHRSITRLKKKYGLEGKTVLSTFGLLGPGKSIETTLNALPEIVKQFSDVIFLVLGKTHPTLVKHQGETYRQSLIDKVKELELEEHVQFVDKFLPLENLLEYLQLSDIYIFSSKDPNQAVSGTFSYAMSCGCAIISTPIPHAKEFLSGNNGLLFDFGDSAMLAKQLKVLLNDEDYRKELGRNALHNSSATSWENSALLHGKLFQKHGDDLELKYHKPEIKFDHLKKMTTAVGMIQFSRLNKPDLGSGYTLDDNARALIVACHNYKYTQDESLFDHMKIYLKFILNCQRFDGSFLNYVDENEKFTDQNDEVNLQDSNGRGIWALGEFLTLKNEFPSKWSMCFRRAKDSIEDFLCGIENINSPRAMAFIIKGLQPTHEATTNPLYVKSIKLMGSKLLDYYHTNSQDDWKWLEPYLTYGNSVLPEAMLKCYELTKNKDYKVAAHESFNFLLDNIFRDNEINVISNQNWFTKGEDILENPIGGQQPIDVAYTILALHYFHNVFPNEGYDKKMAVAFDWFLGHNHLNQIIYNPCTTGCFDGLELNNVNLNQGAESTLSYLMARLVFEGLEKETIN